MLTPRQVPVGTSATPLINVPGGPCTLVITNAGTATIYFGAGTAVTTSSGHPVPTSQTITLINYVGSAPVALYALTAGGTVPTGVTISTGQ